MDDLSPRPDDFRRYLPKMSMLNRQLLLCAVVLVVGCSKVAEPPASPAPVAGIYRFGQSQMNGTPGLDMGSIYFDERRIVL